MPGRHAPDSPKAVVTQIAFSPSSNLLAWVSSDGNLSRWTDVIPSSHPNPVSSSKSAHTNKSAPATSSTKAGASTSKSASSKKRGYDEDNDAGDDVNMDGDGDDAVDDEYGDLMNGWIDDDLGIGMGEKKGGEKRVFEREMGTLCFSGFFNAEMD